MNECQKFPYWTGLDWTGLSKAICGWVGIGYLLGPTLRAPYGANKC